MPQEPSTSPLPPPRSPDGPYRVCCVCLGNICRSPKAEVVLRAQLDEAGLADKVVVDSAGTGDWHVGDTTTLADPAVVEEIKTRAVTEAAAED